MLAWFVGQVMKDTGGKANPRTVNELLKAKLGVWKAIANQQLIRVIRAMRIDLHVGRGISDRIFFDPTIFFCIWSTRSIGAARFARRPLATGEIDPAKPLV
jgi:hypothetical protein